jgi:hypothetical protein
VSGTVNPRVLERLARFGSGWIPWGPFVRDPAGGVAQAREALEAAGRNPAGLQVQGTLPVVKGSDGSVDLARTMDGVPALVDAGITDFRAYLPVPDDANAAMDYFAGVVTAFRETVGRSPHPATV